MHAMRVCRLTLPVPKANVASNSQLLNSRQVFAMDTLHRLGVPETQRNADVLLTQFEAEEPPGTSAPYNPGNIEVATAQSFGYRNVGSWGLAPQIATFPTWVEGVDAYATALRKIAPQAVADLEKENPDQAIRDLGASGWGTSTSLMESIYASGSEGGSARLASVTGGASGGQNTLTPPKSSGGDSIIPSIPGLPGLPSNPITALVGAITGSGSGIGSFVVRGGKILIGILLIVAVVFIAVRGGLT